MLMWLRLTQFVEAPSGDFITAGLDWTRLIIKLHLEHLISDAELSSGKSQMSSVIIISFYRLLYRPM